MLTNFEFFGFNKAAIHSKQLCFFHEPDGF
jgi:hypothetical protein